MARQMKESGISWIGQVPQSWEVVRTKNCYTNKKQVVGDEADSYERLALTLNGVIKRPKDDVTGLQPEEFSGYQILRENELVFKLIDLANVATSRVGYSPYVGIVSPAYIILHPKNDDESRFGEYYFLSMWQREIFNHMGDDGVRSSLNATDLLNIPYLLVPNDEKSKIVKFLDATCAEIDAVITKTKATIEEYKKLKQSIITEAVTKGIRGDRPMKESGIEWIGDIPVDWNVKKGKWILKHLEKPVKEDDGVITCFRDGEVTLRSNRREDGFTFALQEIGYQGIDVNDLVVHGMDGFAGAIGVSDSRGKASPVLQVLDSSENKRYIMYYLRNMAYNGIFIALATGIRVRSCDTNWNKLKELPYIIPSTEEQQEIASYIDKKCAEVDALIGQKTALLEEMETYKKSVIYEYVTGKKEVASESTQTVTLIYPYFPSVLATNKPRFAQAVLMSKILDSNVSNMGRVKLEKMLFTIEHSLGFDFDTEYSREAAGPLDSSIYECERVISRANKWFYINSSKYGVSYKPQGDMSKYKKYYEQYFSEYNEEIERIINVFRNYSLDQAEIVATLYGAWNDFIIDNKAFTDEDIVDDVLNNWNDSKKRFSKDVWLRAIESMRKNNLVPKGYGKHTVTNPNS